jgi:acyl-CoA synthetase (AMP-forming)/AMP-acid ligase II
MRVYTSGPRTLREIALAIGAFGDRPLLVYRDEHWTYAEQARIVAGLARYLAEEYGLRKGDRVAVCMRNYPEWMPVFWATQALGLVLVPLNAWWTAAELRYALADSGARLVVADAERIALLRELGPLEARELIRREQLTGVSGVPTVMRKLIEDAAVHPEDYTSLAGIAMGGAPHPPGPHRHDREKARLAGRAWQRLRAHRDHLSHRVQLRCRLSHPAGQHRTLPARD